MFGNVENHREINLEELLRDGPCARVIEAPVRTVGENSPAELARREIVDPPEVPEHLGGWGRFLATSPGAAVQRPKPSFRFHDCFAVLIAGPGLGDLIGPLLRRGIREQHSVRYVFLAARRQILFPETLRPAKTVQYRPDQIVFGLAFIGRAVRGEVGDYPA